LHFVHFAYTTIATVQRFVFNLYNSILYKNDTLYRAVLQQWPVSIRINCKSRSEVLLFCISRRIL